jgi:uncharacterized Zn finger protein
MRKREHDDYYWPEPSRPLEAKGGIKAQSKRGGFGESWWAKRWMATLESFNLGGRLTRGRSYARKGQVLSIDIEKGEVKAKVQGSQPKPYAVSMKVATLSEDDWKRVIETLSGQALFAAKLAAGEMPNDIEEAFRGLGLSLFPEKKSDLETKCSCPDYSNPCKHIAAVYCLLGEEFDRDPFLLFRMRGISREELAGRIAEPAAEEGPSTESREPLPADPSAFWSGAPMPDDLLGETRIPPVSAALPKRLGGFPFWRAQTPLLEALEPMYASASARGWETFLGEGRKDSSVQTASHPAAGGRTKLPKDGRGGGEK